LDSVIVSPSYEVEIPRAIRESMSIAPGDEFEVVAHDGRFELIPVRNSREFVAETAVERGS
jgi:AbrB family looped-hinge helix DNA binding protein